MMDNERIAKFDNIRFWMILCVVIGHVLYVFRGDPVADAIYVFVYSFHMPVLIFLSGMFSKHAVDNRRYETVIQYLAIYLIMKFLEALSDYMIKERFSFYFLWESGPAWFALAMAVFILVTMLIRKYDRRCMLILALMVGCLAGLDTHFGNHFASMRICVFYPVFLAGYYTDPKQLILSKTNTVMRALIRIVAAAVLVLIFIVFFLFSDRTAVLLQLFKGKYAYDEMGMGIEVVVLRLICYAFWIALGGLIFLATGEHEAVYTWIGTRTMSVFIWHSFIISMLLVKFNGKGILIDVLPHLYIPAALITALIITVASAYLPGFRIADRLRDSDNSNTL